jgi:hypothetical protein
MARNCQKTATHHRSRRHRHLQPDRPHRAAQQDIWLGVTLCVQGFALDLLAKEKKTMNAGRLPLRIIRGNHGTAARREGMMMNSAPYLSASAPTMGPVANVGAEAATMVMSSAPLLIRWYRRTVDEPDKGRVLVPEGLDAKGQAGRTSLDCV